MLVDICSNCNNRIAIADGLCGECSDKPVSQQIHEAAQREDNDFKAFGMHNKAMREERLERFIPWLEKLENAEGIISIETKDSGTKFTINTEEYGIVDYFPKANKLLIRKQNKWIKPGLKWMMEHFIK